MPRPLPRLLAYPLAALFLAGLPACKKSDTGAPQAASPQPAASAPASASASGAGAGAREEAAVPDSAGILARADSGRIQGAPAAPVWVIVASDFQCPFCKVWHDDTYPMIVRDYVRTGKVRIAYLNFPLRNHQHAVKTAEAAMCAAVQGRFWEMHDAIFDTQQRWSALAPAPVDSLLDSLATAAVPDGNAWRGCMNSHATLPLIQADFQRSMAAGVQSTPSFYIGTRALAGAQPAAVFRDAIEAALAQAGSR